MRNLQKRMELVLTVAIALLGMTSGVSVGADWSAVNSGLINLDVRALAIDPANKSILYAATFYGLHKTTDGGATWHVQTSSLTAVTSLAVDFGNSDIVYMGRWGGGCFERLYKSTDGGLSWSRNLSLDTEFCETIRTVIVDPSNSNNLYVILNEYALLKSRDGGTTWKALPEAKPSFQSFYTLAIDPLHSDTLYAGTTDFPLRNAGTKGLFKSLDGGITFSITGLRDTGVNAVAIDPLRASTVYAATVSYSTDGVPERFRGLFKSTDGGASWFPINSGLSELVGTNSIVSSFVISPASPDTLFTSAEDTHEKLPFESDCLSVHYASYLLWI